MNFYPNFPHMWADLAETEDNKFPYNSADRCSGSHSSLGDVKEKFPIISTLILALARIRQTKCQQKCVK